MSRQQTLARVRPADQAYFDSLSPNEKKKALPNLTSVIDYPDIYPSADLSYTVEAERVKESIILRQKVTNPTYSFSFRMKNLTAKLLADKTVVFYDSQNQTNAVFTIQAPYMYDAAGEESKDIQVALTNTADGFLLTVTPNNEWLSDPNRTYPVVVDPPITTSVAREDINDSFVSSTGVAGRVRIPTSPPASS